MTASTEPPVPFRQLVNTSQHVNNRHPGEPRGPFGPGSSSVVSSTVSFKDTAALSPARRAFPALTVQDSGPGRMPRESLDAPEDLPKEALRQVAFWQLPAAEGDPPEEIGGFVPCGDR
jgi:hypothetical protein